MPGKPLQVRLEVTDQRQGQFTLSFDSSQYPITLNLNNITFSEWLRRLRPVIIGGHDPAGDIDPQDLLRNIGVRFWQALLPESAPVQEREALARLLRTGQTPLLLDLPDTLAELPWELLRDPEQSDKSGFLALRRPLVRISSKAAQVASIELPLRVLLLISSPPTLGEDSRVDVESERVAVEQATCGMREAGFLHLLVEDIVTPKRVEHLLDRFKPHIVHYVGHGEYDQTNGGTLLWEDDQGNVFPLSASHLASLLCSRNLHAVVLHGCETAKGNARIQVQSLADTLAQEGLPAVLAMQANFTYESSQLASRTWYQALVSGQSMAEALLTVRQALTQADRPDWAVPILQGRVASLAPVLDATSIPGSPDPLLTRQGAAADIALPTEVFVGRHRELRALHLMLENAPNNGSVLALITGPGGMGKSTLVAQAVTRYGRIYKAALMLRCQEYQSIDLFLQSIGAFLKRLGTPDFLEYTLPDPKLNTEAKIDKAVAALNLVGPVLLIIDNLESVQNENQMISDKGILYLLQTLLANLHGGRVLITGRYMVKEPLLQEGLETKLLHLGLDDLSLYETHQLLLRYPTLAALGEVVRQKIVSEFGGLPYVYDLLSSRAASQDLEALIHDVQDRITQEHKRRTAEEWQEVRRQVIEFAALAVTVNRLSEVSRVVLAQLSVLHRPFPLAAIEEGLGAERIVWQPLLERSLLHCDPQEKSYRLHGLTRRYAEGLLDEDGRKQARIQLAVWYERYARQDSHHLADYLEAHRLWRSATSVQQAGQLVMHLVEPLSRVGLYPLLRDLCTTTLSDIRGSDEGLTANALHELGKLASLRGEYEEARGLYQQSLDLFEQLGDQRGRAATLHHLGIIAQDQGEYEEARDLYQQSLDIRERLGDQYGRASSFGQLGMMAQQQGKDEEARSLYQQSLKIYERLGDQNGRASILHQLGMMAQHRGEYEEARGLYRQSLKIYERLGDQIGQANSLGQLGVIASDQGEYEEARGFYQQSLEIFERLGDQSRRVTILHQLGVIASDQGEYEEARSLYQQSLDIFERLGSQWGQAGCLHSLGVIAQDQGEYEEARGLYRRSLEIQGRLGNQSGRADTLHDLGGLSYLQGEYEEARGLYQQSLDLFEQLGDQKGRAAALHHLGIIAQDQGEYEEARDLYQQSLDIYERLGDQSGRAGTLHNLGNLVSLQGKHEEARGLYQQSLEIFERLGDQKGRAVALHQLGMMAELQEKYQEAYRLYQQSLEIAERLGDQSGQASTLHQLGIIAQNEGNYEEARGLYQQSLDIQETIGDQSGRADSLGQLGLLIYEQGNFKDALVYLIQAYILFDTLRSPTRAIILRTIARIRSHMDEKTFNTQWRMFAGNQPLPILPTEDTQQLLKQVVIDFVLAPTLNEGRRLLEAHLELLQPEADLLLQELATQQELDDIRKVIEERRLFLGLCRNMGIFAALAEFQANLSSEEETGDTNEDNSITIEELQEIISTVVLRGTLQDRQQVVALLIAVQQQVPLENMSLRLFLGCQIAALRGEEVPEVIWSGVFIEWWQIFQDTLSASPDKLSSNQQESEKKDTVEDSPLRVEELPSIVSFAISQILQGTVEQCQQLAAGLIEAQQQLPPEEAPLGRFWICLAAILRGETPEVALLEPPYTEWWQAFQDVLSVSPDESSYREKEKT